MNELQELYKKYKSYVLREDSSPVQKQIETQNEKSFTNKISRENDLAGVERGSVVEIINKVPNNQIQESRLETLSEAPANIHLSAIENAREEAENG